MRRTWYAGAVMPAVLLALLVAAGLVPAWNAQADDRPAPEADAGAAKPHRHYTGLAEHFQAANSLHDGKLTLAQARQDGWKRVMLHFGEIDAEHLGYVTMLQIHAYNAIHRYGSRTASVASGD